ncbi:hypothetical protein ACQ4PT_068172 [Festuca glaucescens]
MVRRRLVECANARAAGVLHVLPMEVKLVGRSNSLGLWWLDDPRYELFDMWWKERCAFTGMGNTSTTANGLRSKHAGLTHEPCFWARVEEAHELTERAKVEHGTKSVAMKLGSLREFIVLLW